MQTRQEFTVSLTGLKLPEGVDGSIGQAWTGDPASFSIWARSPISTDDAIARLNQAVAVITEAINEGVT